MPNLSGLQASLGTVTDILGKVAIVFTAAIVIITLISPALAGRMLGWWYRRVAIRERFEAAAAAAAAAHPSPTSPATASTQQATTTANASAIAAPPPTTPQVHAPLPPFPTLQPQAPVLPIRQMPPSPMPVRQWPPTAPATPPASAPAPKQVQAPGAVSVARLRVPRYWRAWWLALAVEVLSLTAYVIAFSTVNTSEAFWFFGAFSFALSASLMLAIWAVSTAVRLRGYRWAWGIGISTLVLLFLGPLAVLPTLVFTIIGPVPATGRFMASHPRFAWVAFATATISLLGFEVIAIGLGILGISETFSDATGQATITDPASYATGNTIGEIGLAIWLLALLVALGLNIWAFVNSLILRRWGWAITSLVLGYLPFAFNGPTTRPAPAQIRAADPVGHP